MRSAKDIEESLRRAELDIKIDAEADRAILRELTDFHRNAAPCDPGRGRLAYTALAAAAAVVIVTALILKSNRREGPAPAAAMSPAEMLTIRQLGVAYHRGGLEALEAQCEKAADRMDVQSEPLSLTDLIIELEGT